MSRDSPSNYKSFLILADIPIFVIVGIIIGYFFSAKNPQAQIIGSLGMGIIFFILSLIPVIRLAIRENRSDKQKLNIQKNYFEQESELVKNTLLTDNFKKNDKKE
ncbi:MAG: hypothetical protein ACFFD1_00395 [Candidatus Thorarchaeota archaeon]